MPDILIRPVGGKDTLALRSTVLRPDLPGGARPYPEDGLEDTRHLGAFLDGALVGCGTILRDPQPEHPDEPAWRVRGMAVAEAARGHGLGGAILDGLVAHAEALDGSGLVWLNGRLAAEAFYRRHGFLPAGDLFDTPPTGWHYRMLRRFGRQ